LSPNSEQEISHLLDQAVEAGKHALAPYSNFNVGAALEDELGEIWTGCNIESSSFGLTICAERVALVKALSEGVRSFKRIVIAASGENITPPCGACLQLLNDYAPEIEVVLYNPDSAQTRKYNLSDLLPHPFKFTDYNKNVE